MLQSKNRNSYLKFLCIFPLVSILVLGVFHQFSPKISLISICASAYFQSGLFFSRIVSTDDLVETVVQDVIDESGEAELALVANTLRLNPQDLKRILVEAFKDVLEPQQSSKQMNDDAAMKAQLEVQTQSLNFLRFWIQTMYGSQAKFENFVSTKSIILAALMPSKCLYQGERAACEVVVSVNSALNLSKSVDISKDIPLVFLWEKQGSLIFPWKLKGVIGVGAFVKSMKAAAQ
ncbi:MAG: hypothetical protein NT027_05030 [Proteobacteria bacterium]|nr:hypothetical protein [Pseudomonadota bacterium]